MPYDAFAAGLGDHRIVTTLCPGGKERMRRLMAVIERGRESISRRSSRIASRWIASPTAIASSASDATGS
jgi:hypothetical protein